MKNDFPKTPEQRHYKRVDLQLPVKIEIDGVVLESTTENVSCGGMFMPVSQKQFELQDTLVATLSLPEGHKKEVKLKGEVCRVSKNTDNSVGGIAVQFSGLYDENHLELDRLIKWNLLN